jgi:hypothetical protein
MKRTYISPEYDYYRVYGTLNMVEESNFFGSKMLEIEDSFTVGKQDIIYYQNLKGEQLDYSVESSLTSYVYSDSTNKKENHTLELDESQPQFQLEKNAKWILTIDLDKIFREFIFATLKKYRTFELIKNEMTIYSDVNIAIKNYIDFNVKDRYKITSIDLYISYKDLRKQNILQYKNSWNPVIETPENKFSKFQTETAIDKKSIRIIFNQDKPANLYNMDYFFNINYEKL